MAAALSTVGKYPKTIISLFKHKIDSSLRCRKIHLCVALSSEKPIRIDQKQFSSSQGPEFGLLFDIDGVVVRGRELLPGARDAFRMLLDNANKFYVPTIFVTNAGNCLRQSKASQLSEWLGVTVREDQVVMSHSPLKFFSNFYQKHMLVSGQGPVKEIAKYLGFTHVTTIDTLTEAFPQLDMVDHKRRRKGPDPFEKFFPKIEGIILFGEPVRWETSLQLIIDVLVTNGQPSEAPVEIPYPHIPILGCNMDLLWMSEACMPRFAHGTFLHCLESLYEKITGYGLKYTALVGKPSELTYLYSEHMLQEQAKAMDLPPIKRMYCIGDNPDADIYGANLYNRYLQNKMEKISSKRQKKRQVASYNAAEFSDDNLDHQSSVLSNNITSLEKANRDHSGVEACISMLVCTGVFSQSRDYSNNRKGLSLLNHNHRDFIMDPDLRKPHITSSDVLDAVKTVFEREGL